MRKLFSTKIWIVLAVVLVAAGGGGYYFYDSFMAPAAAAEEEPALQTSVARRGDLTVFASGVGVVTPAKEVEIGFDESGTLLELLVSVGDQVNAGQALAHLQTANSEEEIAASIAEGELSVLQAQNNIDSLLEDAESNRAAAMSEIQEYAQEVRDAQYSLDYYLSPSEQKDLSAIEAFDLASEKLDTARQAFEPYKYLSSSNDTRSTLLEALNDAQADYDSALKRLDYEYQLATAQANLNRARADYDKFKDGPDSAEMAIAEAELANAKANLSLKSEQQSVLELVSPMDGTVMGISASVGESLGASSFITLADLSQPLVEIYLDETDLDKAVVGNEVEVVFDALPDETFGGQIVSVLPELQTVSNVSTLTAEALLDSGPIDRLVSLPVGLTASVDVISGRAMNAVLVPIEALREIDDNQYAVFVVEDGEPRMRMVSVGLIDFTSAEITSGLEAGEVVSTGLAQTQ